MISQKAASAKSVNTTDTMSISETFIGDDNDDDDYDNSNNNIDIIRKISILDNDDDTKSDDDRDDNNFNIITTNGKMTSPSSKDKNNNTFLRLYNTSTKVQTQNKWLVYKRVLEERKKKIKPKDNQFLSYGTMIINQNSQSIPHKEMQHRRLSSSIGGSAKGKTFEKKKVATITANNSRRGRGIMTHGKSKCILSSSSLSIDNNNSENNNIRKETKKKNIAERKRASRRCNLSDNDDDNDNENWNRSCSNFKKDLRTRLRNDKVTSSAKKSYRITAEGFVASSSTSEQQQQQQSPIQVEKCNTISSSLSLNNNETTEKEEEASSVTDIFPKLVMSTNIEPLDTTTEMIISEHEQRDNISTTTSKTELEESKDGNDNIKEIIIDKNNDENKSSLHQKELRLFKENWLRYLIIDFDDFFRRISSSSSIKDDDFFSSSSSLLVLPEWEEIECDCLKLCWLWLGFILEVILTTFLLLRVILFTCNVILSVGLLSIVSVRDLMLKSKNKSMPRERKVIHEKAIQNKNT